MAKRAAVSEVRAWAKDNGFDIADRGRLPGEVWDAWAAAAEPAGDRGPGRGNGRVNGSVPTQPSPRSAEPVPSIDPAALRDAQKRITQLETQLEQLTSRLAALENQPPVQVQPRRLFSRSK